MAEENEEKKSRIGLWFSLGAFSTIALVAITSNLDDDLGDEPKEVKWSASAISVALGLAGLAVFAHVARDRFIGTPVEGGLAVICLGILAAALPTIMKPSNRIAVDRDGSIGNANLYFFSWGAFIQAVMVMAAYLRDVHGVERRNVKFHTLNWMGLCASSFVTMVAASRIFQDFNCDNFDSDFCDRTQFAISLGAISGLFSAIWLPCGARLPAIVDGFLGICMLVLWVFGVAYITFGGNKAPAFDLGNLYFATWISFMLACRLAANGAFNIFTKGRGGDDGGDEEKKESQKPDEEEPAEAEETGEAAEAESS
jgi:hypothetical protein